MTEPKSSLADLQRNKTHILGDGGQTHTQIYKAALHIYTLNTHISTLRQAHAHIHTHAHTFTNTHTYTQQTALLMNVDHNSGGLSLTPVLPPCIKEKMPGEKRIDSVSQ